MDQSFYVSTSRILQKLESNQSAKESSFWTTSNWFSDSPCIAACLQSLGPYCALIELAAAAKAMQETRNGQNLHPRMGYMCDKDGKLSLGGHQRRQVWQRYQGPSHLWKARRGLHTAIGEVPRTRTICTDRGTNMHRD